MAGQFATRENWLRCEECEGRSFSDPTKEFHYPECSRYREWRFGKKNVVGGERTPTSAQAPAGRSGKASAPPPTTSELIEDKVRDAILEDLWREVNGEVLW